MSDFARRIVNRKNVGIGNVKFAPNFLDHGADEAPHAIFVGDAQPQANKLATPTRRR
jgi:hypothetical protein